MGPGVGKTLRDARAERGIELGEVERATKIRVRFLRAIEEERWGDLPAPAYARGFLSAYAHFLGLDEGELLAEYRRSAGDADRAEPIPPQVLKPSGARRRPRRSLFGRSRTVKPAALLLSGLVVVALLALAIAGLLGDSDDGDGGSGEREVARAGSAADRPEGASDVAGPRPAPQTTLEVELRATEAVWVCLVDGRGRALVNGETLAAGERRGPFEGPLFVVTFGNGSVELTVDGEPARIPAVAEPLGFRIRGDGLRELEPSAQPTCV